MRPGLADLLASLIKYTRVIHQKQVDKWVTFNTFCTFVEQFPVAVNPMFHDKLVLVAAINMRKI